MSVAQSDKIIFKPHIMITNVIVYSDIWLHTSLIVIRYITD